MSALDLSPIDALHPHFDAEHQLLVLELHHGKANEMGSEQLAALRALCELVEEDDRIRSLCTTSRRVSSKGTPIFIAGANVTERAGWDDARVQAHVVDQRALMRRLRRLPVFSIVVPQGVTLGWGTEFVLTADYAVAARAAAFALPETGLGIIPGARGTAELAHRVGPAHALRLGCTGEKIDAAEALRIGLVQEVVEDVDAGMARARAMAAAVAKRSPTAVAAFKDAMLEGLGESESIRLEAERRAYAWAVTTGDAAIGRQSFAEIRAGSTPAWGPRKLLRDS